MPAVPRYDCFAPSSERASKTARAIRRTDTKAELALRVALRALGLRYRKHAQDLPGRPDVVFRGARVAVFCDGDFWHGRQWRARKAQLAAGSNAAYWIAKIESNIRRDRRHARALRRDGWAVLRFWETDILADPVAVAHAVALRAAASSSPRRRSDSSSDVASAAVRNGVARSRG